MTNFSSKRKEYRLTRLDLDMLDNNPFVQLTKWLNDALQSGLYEPTAMALSTVSADGKPSSRMVLLKDIDNEGLVFFTNYDSKKGQHLAQNPNGALLFFWPELERQVRIEGKISKIKIESSDEYFNSRPEGGKIGAWASPQSKRIPNREYLESLHEDFTRLFQSRVLNRPENWGGYKLLPDLFEFWQGRENRLHDRFEYTLSGYIWEIYRLAP